MSDETKPIVINPSVIATLAPVLLRQVLLVVGGSVMIVGLLKQRDMAGLYAYLQSEDFITFIATGAVLLSLGYGQLRSLWDKANLVTLGRKAPDSDAIVKEPTPPPAVTEP